MDGNPNDLSDVKNKYVVDSREIGGERER